MADLSDPNHPLLIQGRRHARDALFSAERFNRMATGSADRAATTSVAFQMLASAVMADHQDVTVLFSGLAGSLIWAINKLPAEDRRHALNTLFEAVAAGTVDPMMAEEVAKLN